MNTLIFENILACPMCMSGAEGKSLLAANSAIAVMLVFLFAMLGSFFTFIIFLARRSRKFAEELPGESN
ncbi:hypothetical protein N9B73_05465 [Verrucomicrobiales bacterium]|nr:hypothetical protein [Verrucomicrobiales bacterium]